MCHRTFNSLCRVITYAGWAGVLTNCYMQKIKPAKKKRDATNSKTPTSYGEGSCVFLPFSLRLNQG